MMQFAVVPVGASFQRNGNLWVKVSSRTARLVGVGRIFYFGQADLCDVKTR